MRSRHLRGFGCCFALLFILAGTAQAQTISAINPTNGSTPLDAFEPNGSIIPAIAKYDTLSSVSVTSSSATTFTTRYISTNSVDSEALQPAWTQTLNSSYQISFTVVAPGLYELQVDTMLVGDLCLDDDNIFPPAGNWAQIFDVAGSQSGGSLSGGSLNLTFPGGSQRLDDTSTSFDPITSPFNLSQSATISGSSFGVPKVHTLSFSWTQQSSTPATGDPSTIRLGQESRLPDVSACTYSVPPRPIAPDGHWVTVTLTSLSSCGDGSVDVGEECDAGGANGQPGSCCTSSCTFEAPTTVCRSTSAGDLCDDVEFCTGASGSCPADDVLPAGTECRSAADDCDAAETCDGLGKQCPADGVASAGTVCRAAAGDCDAAETCDGVAIACPADAKESGVCRPAVDVCDAAESCDGAGDDCPPDGFQSAATPCRSAAGVCDVAESCTGSGPSCPADLFASGGVCRPAAGACDVAESCSGSGPSCPADLFASGGVCRPSAGECDAAEQCDGASAACPADLSEPNGTACSDDGAFCTGAETCQNGACVSAGDPCSPDLCDESGDQCLTFGCPPAPAGTCLSAAKSILLYKDKSSDSRDKLIYKWVKGQSTTQEDLADPLTSASYDLCIYAGSTSALLAQAHVPPSSTRWKRISSKGFKYKDSSGSEDGAQKLLLKGSDQNKSKALWKGKGINLPELPAMSLPIAEFPVTVQLLNDQGSVCMQSVFGSEDVKRNAADQLKLRDP